MIGLLTFHWADDFGAMLQAYALKHCLENMGERVEVIPYAPFRLSGRYWWCPLLARSLPDGQVKYWFDHGRLKYNIKLGPIFWRRKRAMRAFRRRYLSARPAIRSACHIYFRKYDRVFVGSDQVWNPEITVKLDDAYIGNIKGRGACPMIAYAASMGRSALPESCQEKFARCAGQAFSAISVREASAVPFLEWLLHRRVIDLVDPVFLLQQEDWRRIQRLPAEKDYILLHWTERNDSMARYALTLAQQSNKKLIQTSLPSRNGQDRRALIHADGGPAEFLGYIQNASCVVTNSFHAAAFSVLLEKQFIAFRHSSYNSRLSGLTEKLGLQARLYDKNCPPEPDSMWREIDWPAVQSRIAAERKRAIQFICSNIKN